MLQELQSFFAALIHSADSSFDDLLGLLISTDIPSIESGCRFATQALYSNAQCVAVLCLAAGDQKCSSTVKMLAARLKADSTAYSVRFCNSFLIKDKEKKIRNTYVPSICGCIYIFFLFFCFFLNCWASPDIEMVFLFQYGISRPHITLSFIASVCFFIVACFNFIPTVFYPYHSIQLYCHF